VHKREVEADAMAYDDSRFRGEPGFREEPDFRLDNGLSEATTLGGASNAAIYTPGSYSPSYSGNSSEATEGTVGLSRRLSQAQLDDVFDDPEHGDPGMDRMTVHVLWEVVLLAATVGLALWFSHAHHAGVSGSGLRGLLLAGATLGFLTIGVGLSLRAGAVNLAVGPIAAACALFYATHSDRGLATTIGIALVLAGAAGVAIGLATVALHVPAWAASLAGGFAVIVWIQQHVTIPSKVVSNYDPARHAFYWYGGFAALALLGGFLGLVKPIRRGLGRFRPVGDPALRRGGGGAFVAFLAITGSSLLAGLAGVLAALSNNLTEVVVPADSYVTTGLALGAALVGGTSAFGRRGGVFGSLLAATLLILTISYAGQANLRISPYALAAGTIVAGLVVTRLVEAFGRPSSGRAELDEDDPWSGGPRSEQGTNGSATNTAYSTPRQGGWTSQLPARSNDDTWGGAADSRWGSR
jgi:ribose/xylose/arabinose/galactoside ABC-type transport system permease subunit